MQQEAGKTLQFTEVPNLGDGAAYFSASVTVSGQTFNGSGLYGLKGLIFYGFSNISFSQPTLTPAALQAEAQTVLGRLP